VSEPQREPLGHGGTGVGGQVAAGDPEVELTRPDVDRNVLGPQEEELDVVDAVDDGEVLRVPAAPVAGLGQDLGGRLAQCALVGHGDAEHLGSADGLTHSLA
jgi:hypothetical protein